MQSHFIFLDSVKTILVHCAHRLLSQLTLILCTLKTATVESRRPAFDVCFGLCSPSRNNYERVERSRPVADHGESDNLFFKA